MNVLFLQRMKKSSSSSAPNPRALQRTESSATAPLTRDPLRNFGSNDEPNVQSSSHPVPSAPLPAKRAEVSAYARELLRGDDGQEQALSFEELRARVHFEKVQQSMQTVVSNNNVSAKSSSRRDGVEQHM